MAGKTNFDARQVILRGVLAQLLPYLTDPELDNLLVSIDSDLQLPLRVTASNPASLIVNVAPSVVSNPESNRQRTIPHIGSSLPLSGSKTVTFPASSGGTINGSDGSSAVLTLPSGQYCKVLLAINTGGTMVITPGSADPVEANAAVPAPIPNTLPFAFVTLHNLGGTVQVVPQAKIVQFQGGGGGSGSGTVAGAAQEVSLNPDDTSVVVTFPSALPGNNYVVIAQLVNTLDASPQFQDVVVTNKTSSGFTAKWNAGVDSANYRLAYIVPVVQEQIGEVTVPAGNDNLTVTLPIALAGSNYSVIAELVNTVDTDVEYQSVTITDKQATSFTAKWNAPTDSANYKLSFHIAQYQ